MPENWQRRLTLACTRTLSDQEEEQRYFRQEAEAAPLDQLELFLDKPGSSNSESGRAVMRQVLSKRHDQLREQQLETHKRAEWLRGFFQQFSAQVLSGLAVAFLLGLLAGWFTFTC